MKLPNRIFLTGVPGSRWNDIDKTLAGITWHPERMDDPWIPDEIQDLLKI